MTKLYAPTGHPLSRTNSAPPRLAPRSQAATPRPAPADRLDTAAVTSRFTAMPSDNALRWGGIGPRIGARLGKLNVSGDMARQQLMPGAYNAKTLRAVELGEGARVHTLHTVLGGRVDMRAYPAHDPERAHVTIVGFHGNGCTADDMDDLWQSLRHEGTVYAVNLPGYGNSSVPDDRSELELHMGATAQAVRDSLTRDRGIRPAYIAWYGLSLGGSVAAIAFAMTPGSHLVVDKTFTSVRAVVSGVMRRIVCRGSALRTGLAPLGGMLANLAVRNGMPRGLRRRNLAYTTDGLNTVKKLAKIHAEGNHATAGSKLLVFGAGADKLMEASYPAELARAYYGDDVPDGRMHIQPRTGHNVGLNRASMQIFHEFLRSI